MNMQSNEQAGAKADELDAMSSKVGAGGGSSMTTKLIPVPEKTIRDWQRRLFEAERGHEDIERRALDLAEVVGDERDRIDALTDEMDKALSGQDINQ